MPKADHDGAKRLFEEAERELRSMRVGEACTRFHLAEEAGYEADACAAERWRCHMLLGEFEAAWMESDAISRRGRPDPHRFWDGRPFDDRHVLIRCLHGLGDTLQYLRFVPLVRARAATLTIEAQPPLKSLLQECGLADAVITWGEAAPHWDQQVEIVELSCIFRVTEDTIPSSVPYVNISVGSQRVPSNGKDRGLRVGVVWASGAFNPKRCVPLGEFAGLFKVEGATFFSFQAGAERAGLEGWADCVSDSYKEGQSVLATAIELQRMDLVITVDTMVAHLAGAMGLRVWTLLPFACDWRWMRGRSDSPWYPAMRLFRQHREEDWSGVLNTVRGKLDRLVHSPGSKK